MIDPRAYWVSFNLVKGIGAARTRTLLDHFGSLQIAWKAGTQQLIEAGLGERVIDNLPQVRRQVDLEEYGGILRSRGSK